MEGAVRVFLEERNKVRTAAIMYPTTPDGDFKSKLERDFWEGIDNVPGGVGDPVAQAVNNAFGLIEGMILPLVSDGPA